MKITGHTMQEWTDLLTTTARLQNRAAAKMRPTQSSNQKTRLTVYERERKLRDMNAKTFSARLQREQRQAHESERGKFFSPFA
jgi:hypothetical protein